MTVRFVIDERSINLNGLSQTDGEEVIEDLLDLIEDARSDGDEVCYDDELFHMAIVGDRTFWDLCAPGSPVHLSHEVLERAAATFGSMAKWYEVDSPSPSCLDVSVDGGPIETTASIAWAHEQAVKGGLASTACICASSGVRRSGAVAVDADGRTENVWFLKATGDIEGYFRWLIAEHATHPDEIAALAPMAFRQLDFVEKCFNGVAKMSKNCHLIAPNIAHHLAILSDEGRRIFSGPWDRAPQEFGTFGVDISDENGGTKQNSEAKEERRRVFEGEELIFWWHTKIERHQDRIHIYPNRAHGLGRIVVGIFCKHLTV
jgi:hypothetical protein